MIERFVRPCSSIDDYMDRWWLIGDEEDKGTTRVRVHHILRSDDDRALHDHPWDYTTVILLGGYWEHTVGTIEDYLNDQDAYMGDDGSVYLRRWHGPGSVIRRKAEDRHRLELPDGQTAWTLFTMSPKRREWGFHTRKGFVHWAEYERKV
jgi:hypothetical protein